jgi:PilZ domain
MRNDPLGTLVEDNPTETREFFIPMGRSEPTEPPSASSAAPRVSPPIRRSITQRRREPRIEPVEDRIWIQWWDEEELLGRSARLVNVSRHGAMIVTSALPRQHQTVWLYLEEPAPQVGVKASVLEVIEGRHGVHQVRLGFASLCPDEFFEMAACGFEVWLNRDHSQG